MENSTTGGEVSLYAEFTIRPGFEAEVAAMVENLAEEVRAEPGNVSFEPFVERDRPNRWFVFEVYRDEAAFQAHIAADYGATFNSRLVEVIEESGSQLTFLRR